MRVLALTLLVTSCLARQDVRVTAAPALGSPAQGEATIAIYDVQDLLEVSFTDFEPPQLGLDSEPSLRTCEPTRAVDKCPSAEDADPRPAANDAERRATAARTLEGLIRKYLTPKSEHGPERLEFTPSGALSATLTADQHRWLNGFLTAQRQFTGALHIETHLFTVPRGRLAKLGVDTSTSLPTRVDADAFLRRLRSDAGVESVNAPSLVVHANQRVNIAVLSEVAYVKDYTIEVVEPGAREIADPQIAVIREGVVLDVRATPLVGELIGLDLQLQNAELLRPIRSRKLRLSTSSSAEVEIELPDVATLRIVSTVLLDDGASVVLTAPGQSRDKDLALVVTAHRTGGTATPESK